MNGVGVIASGKDVRFDFEIGIDVAAGGDCVPICALCDGSQQNEHEN